MTSLRALRERRGLSQRDLAAEAGVAFRTVQLIERGEHDARLSTYARLAKALGLPAASVSRAVEGCLASSGDSVEDVSAGIAEEGESTWKGRFFDFIDAFRREPGPLLVAQPPSPRLSPRLQALLASTVEHLCAEQGVPAPLWCAGVRPLASPWFVAGMEDLKALALVESPAHYRRRNIFVLGDFLRRA